MMQQDREEEQTFNYPQTQGNRVTFQDQHDNVGDFADMSDNHAGEEMHDTVHDLHGDPMSATIL